MPDIAAIANHLANRAWALAPGACSSLHSHKVRLVAHGRGTAIENTLAAFLTASAPHSLT